MLSRRAALDPGTGYVFLKDGEHEADALSYAELEAQARALAGRLQEEGARQGDTALLLYPPGLEFVVAFFSCLYAGVAAVPAYPPRRRRPQRTLGGIVRDAAPRLVLTTAAIHSQSRELTRQTPELGQLRWLETTAARAEKSGAEKAWRRPELRGDSLALLQYTSGSTAAPKGVMVTHANLLHNEEMIRQAFGQSRDSVIVGWLPLFHDMGLIGNLLQPLYVGGRCILMSPMAFLQKPGRWLAAIDSYRATTSGGPNFAYDLCVDRIPPEARQELDLSCWRVAFNGSETARAATLDRFAAAFEPSGFRRRAFLPCFGLAEGTLLVTGGPHHAEPSIQSVERLALGKNHVVVESPGGGPDTVALVGCGRAWLGQEVAIVDPASGKRCGADRVGEIWVSGPSVARGYWSRAEETASCFGASLAEEGRGPFLRTGDLGFLRDGELFVTGRLKDLIILRGRNVYPQDVELTAERSHPALRLGCGAAFSVDRDGEERLIVVHEVERTYRGAPAEVAHAIALRVGEEHEVRVEEVVLVRAGTIPKTSSGKIRRGACRAAYLEGRLEIVAASQGESLRASATATFERAAVLALPPAERGSALEEYLADRASAILRLPSGSLATAVRLSGLDSLMAVELRNAIEEDLDVRIPLAFLLEGPDLGKLASRVAEKLNVDAGRGSLPELSSEDGVSDFPLSYGQKAMWFLQRLAPTSSAYNIVGASRIRGTLDARSLKRGLAALVERHASLRTVFRMTGGEPRQSVLEPTAPDFVEEDAREWSPAAVARYLDEEAYRPFDLERPLLRVRLLRRSDDEHLFLVVVHHIVADFWSLAVLVRELGLLYHDDGRLCDLDLLRFRYTDFVRWESELLAGPEGPRLWSYWERRLSGELPVLDLPTDRPRPSVQTFDGSSQPFRIAADQHARIESLGRRRGATLFMTLLSAFCVLLHRYSGQGELVVGAPTAGRNRAAWAGIVGYFLNSLALPIDLTGDPSFTALLAEVRRLALEALEHQDYPFTLLVERLQPQRDPSRSPVFQVMFALHTSNLLTGRELASFALGEEGTEMNLGGLQIESTSWSRRLAQLDLTLIMAELGEEVAASIQYNTDLFDATTMARMARHFRNLVAEIADDGRRISELQFLAPAERRQLTAEWNDSGEPESAPLLFRRVEIQSEVRPGETAVVCGGRALSYRELNQRANQLAHHLRDVGVGPEVRVGLFLERSVEFVVGILGVWKAGGAYVPLDATFPHQRLEWLLEDAAASVVVTRRELAGRLPAGRARAVFLDPGESTLDRQPEFDPDPVSEPGHLAYVIFTSGSTGRPKGVAVEHRQVLSYLGAIRERLDLPPGSSFAMVSTFSADLGNTVLWTSLATGGCLHVVTQECASDAEALADYFRRYPVHCLKIVPSHLAALLAAGAGGAEMLPGRWLVLGGEACRRELVLEVRELAPECRILNHYGPSETTVGVLSCPFDDRGERFSPRTVPVGRPLTGTRVWVVDACGSVAPIGGKGELLVGGSSVSRGYLGRPSRTAESFVPDPWSGQPGARLYRTGDRVRSLPDGRIEFLGRCDEQVKFHGYRLEPGEISVALNRHPRVRGSVVMVSSDQHGFDVMVAYYASRHPLEVGELRSWLAQTLVEELLPSVFVHLRRFPLTLNGKIHRSALPTLAEIRREERPAAVAPRTASEKLLAEIWSELLGVERIGVDDSFFQLGGHSLLVTQVISRLREAFAVELPLRTVFEKPTLGELALVITQQQVAQEDADEMARLIEEVAALSDDELDRRVEVPRAGA